MAIFTRMGWVQRQFHKEAGRLAADEFHEKIQRTCMLLIIVTFLAGATWGPTVSTQIMPSAQACTTAMTATAHAIQAAAKSNVIGGAIIENDDAVGLKIIAGVNRRIVSVIKCI